VYKKTNVHKSSNRYVCRAGFADGIQLIMVFAIFGLFLIEIPEIHVVWRCFFNISKGRQTCLF